MRNETYLIFALAFSCAALAPGAQGGLSCADLTNLKIDGVEIANAVLESWAMFNLPGISPNNES